MDEKERDRSHRALQDKALQLGARDVRLVSPAAVYTAEWVRLKCQFGCDGYGQCLTCPPHSPAPAVTRRMVDEYEAILLVHLSGDWPRLRDLMATLEREAFLMGFYKAFALGSGPCPLCDTCSREYPCAHPERARPSMEASGIDVYATARAAGFPIEVVKDRNCRENYYGLLLVE